ncbi:P-loop containing nucleoside triphosphate hydrolase protein [Thozetella sp. PMI_491]|nr:P-loop containing nucleoside triphosphate hydrolase protein [Thozetella sp. PMI_491]
MLCPPLIGCYNIKTTEVFTVSVDKLRPVQWNSEAMKHLVLDSAKKEMLRGLISRHYNHTLNRQGGDLIDGKGEGLVVLLHGPPGVGKTLTAESLAEIVQKPLIALSVGDLIWDEMQLQRRLQTEFQRAINWDAILLLDEADVVLEARSFEDVRRNGIVSVFLRQLEYYRGVLFLTTNRLNTMDAAFESRIQVGIGFKDLTDDIRQQIWTKLLHIKGYEDVVTPRVLQRLSRAKLNGRQIRNVLNVAEGYSFNEYSRQGCMEERHVLEAVKATLEFQQYLEKAKSNTKLEQSVWAPYRGDNDL